jgi:hypothetical protein
MLRTIADRLYAIKPASCGTRLPTHKKAFIRGAFERLDGSGRKLRRPRSQASSARSPSSTATSSTMRLTPQIEQVELKKKYDAAGEIPFRAIVRAIPNLKDMDLKDMNLRDMNLRDMDLKDLEEQVARKAQAARSGDAAIFAGRQRSHTKQRSRSQQASSCLPV